MFKDYDYHVSENIGFVNYLLAIGYLIIKKISNPMEQKVLHHKKK